MKTSFLKLLNTILHLTGVSLDKNLKHSILYQIENNITPKYIFGEFLKPKLWVRLFKSSRQNFIKFALIMHKKTFSDY